MLTRRLESEVMDTPDEARDYDAMDHGAVNRVFVDDCLAFCLDTPLSARLTDLDQPLSVLDVGTGTAQIPIELCRRTVTCRVTAIDLAAEMLKLAESNIAHAGLSDVIRAEFIDAKQMPYADGAFDAVLSNSIVHHIPEPRAVFAEMLRVLRPGGVLFIRDLLRPSTMDDVDRLVATYAGQENEHSRQMFRDSLRAALTLSEVRDVAGKFGVPPTAATQTSDRHWTLSWQK
ncbi:MAG TPA: methyltransferase domain-containing protein [Planctomycetaceae bacterium]|nr:methyltransferase domain-containing protein [Planctomycetaceae bacterium]